MPIHPRLTSRIRLAFAAGTLAAAVCLSTGSASAGLFDFLLRPNPVYQVPAASAPAPAAMTPQAGAAPRISVAVSPVGPPGLSQGGGQTADFCVRLCDGRFFPVARRNGATSAQVCTALCLAARTRIFHGPEIARARAADGIRYADLDNAFVYRKTLVRGCTCNGKDAFGTAPVDIGGDPTLRPGDLIATTKGLVRSGGARAKAGGDLTPVDRAQVQKARQKLANAVPAR